MMMYSRKTVDLQYYFEGPAIELILAVQDAFTDDGRQKITNESGDHLKELIHYLFTPQEIVLEEWEKRFAKEGPYFLNFDIIIDNLHIDLEIEVNSDLLTNYRKKLSVVRYRK